MASWRDVDWNLGARSAQEPATWRQIEVATLLDIRAELRRIRAVLECSNFTNLPHDLRATRRNVATLTRIAKEKT